LGSPRYAVAGPEVTVIVGGSFGAGNKHVRPPILPRSPVDVAQCAQSVIGREQAATVLTLAPAARRTEAIEARKR